MDVLLISDFGVHHTPGGAQRSNQLIVDAGVKRGHTINCFHYDSDISILENHYDIVISSNLEVISSRLPELVKNIPQLDNHVRLEHDSNLYWNNDFRKYFWQSCKVSFFLTEFHHKFFVESYGDIFPNVQLVPDPIDGFYDLNEPRTDEIGYVGFMHPLKGTDSFIEYVNANKDKSFVVAGWGSDNYVNELRSRENVNFLGALEHYQMLRFYNRIGSLYYKPVCNEPFCRSVGEAILCEVPNLITNDNIGCIHESNRLGLSDFRLVCNNAPEMFWRKIECL